MKRYVHAASDVYELASSKDPMVRWQVAYHSSTPPEVLAQLANDEDDNVREGVAHNDATPANVLAQLANDESVWVRRDVARNSSTPPEALAQLANEEDEWVRREVAGNPSTPSEALAQLANDEEKYVRSGVARNRSTPPEVLVQLANDEDNDVRWKVASNPLTPVEVLVQLANDEDNDVRKSAQKQLNIGPKKSKSTNWSSIISQLDSDAEDCDPFYEQTEAAEYVESLQSQVENNLGVWLEPSVQGGQGGIWIYENGTDETLAEDIDYESFNSDVLSLALESKSEAQFKKAYKGYLKNLIS